MTTDGMDVRTELLVARAELAALRRAQAFHSAVAVAALLAAVGALILPQAGCG